MLISINIKDFTLIDQLDLDFSPSMTVITGETGAGKSIILDSLELALGSKTDPTIIRHGAKRADISTCFDITDCPAALSFLHKNDFDSGNECIIRRVISDDGRSKAFINGSACTLQMIREFGSTLVNIHGQHEHQAILKTEKQLELLDVFACNLELCTTVKDIYNEWSRTKKEFAHLKSLAENQQTQLDFVTYQLQELNSLALQEGELAEITQQHSILSNAEELTKHLNEALLLISDNDNNSILHNLSRAKINLEKNKIIDDKLKNIIELFNTAIIQIEEGANELQCYLDGIDANHENLAALEQRLDNIYSIARKHKVKPEDLFSVHQNLQRQQEELLTLDSNIQNMQSKLAELHTQFKNAACMLSSRRKQAAEKLNSLITKKMQQLGMQGGKFEIRFHDNQPDELKAHGLETIEFYVSANPGLPLQPLSKVVSGGELSRIGLAIQVITATKNTIPILIFDEVDVGIGGKTAEVVGKMLCDLSNNNQVICVTHLAQVAVYGTQHLNITKETDGKDTKVNVTYLTKKLRIAEIARMLGGINITEKTSATASEMLEAAKKNIC